MIQKKSAFSLIEVIFVLMILGIIASIGSSIIVQVFENYITQNALYKVTTKTELVANQIVNRLTYRVQESTIARDPTKSGTTVNVDWIMLKDIPKTTNNFITIEWIGYDNDSFSVDSAPTWSGVANYESSTRDSLVTPASTLSRTQTIVSNLSNAKINLSESNASQNKSPAVLFIQKDGFYQNDPNELPYSPTCMGLIDPVHRECIFRVSRSNDTTFSFLDNKAKIITERYKFVWSAYALVPEDLDGDGLYNLYFYYNYQPWNGEKYTDGQKNLLINNVSVFKFTENGGSIQFKLCVSENIGEAYNISTCKEKAIIR